MYFVPTNSRENSIKVSPVSVGCIEIDYWSTLKRMDSLSLC